MPDGFLNIGHNFAGETDYIIVEWVKSTAQGTPVVGHVTGSGLGVQNDTDATEVYYPAAHVNEQLQITELPTVWFLVRFWRSSDGVAKDVLLLELAGNARTGSVTAISRYEYVVDRGYDNTAPVVTTGVWADPVQDDQGIRDTRLFEKIYWVEERGTGSFLEAEITDRSDAGGGFDFVDTDKYMESGGVYVVYVVNATSCCGDDSGSGIEDGDDDIFILDTDQDYNPVTMGGRTLIVDFSTTVGTLTIPNLALVADSRFKLQTHGGLQRNVKIQFDAGDTIRFMNDDVNSILLGQSEEIEVLIKNNTAYVLSHNTNHNRLGQFIWSYAELINSLKCDGTLLALADYPRVAELIAALPAGSVVDETTWQTSSSVDGQTVYANKGKFMSNGTNFRTPDLRSRMIKALSAVDGSIDGGRYEHQKLINHNHYMGATPDNQNNGNDYLANSHSTGGNSGYSFYGSTNAPVGFKTGNPITGGDTDQKVNNIGLYPLICI